MKLNNLSDEAARAECRRLILVMNDRRRKENAWFGCDDGRQLTFDDNSAFVTGMCALFRYARGNAVPSFVVKHFLDEFLTLMFAGVASGVLALPKFEKMADKPWAFAWRTAELRMTLEQDKNAQIAISDAAHLLGITRETLVASYKNETGNDVRNGYICASYVQQLIYRVCANAQS